MVMTQQMVEGRRNRHNIKFHKALDMQAYTSVVFRMQEILNGAATMKWWVVNTDNFGGDYPNEKFSDGPFDTEAAAQAAADKRNGPVNEYATRYFKVVKEGYILQPRFEP